MADKDFIGYVQDHERSWGNETYTGRPTLQELLRAPVVVFWQPVSTDGKGGSRYTASLHTSLDDVEQYFAKLILRAQIDLPKQRLYRIFASGKEMRVKSIKVAFEPLNNES